MSTIDHEAMDWLVRHFGGELGADERAAFDTWFAADIRHRGAYLRATAIDLATSRHTVREVLQPEPVRLDTEWTATASQRHRGRRGFLAFGGLAAGIALFAALPLFNAFQQESVFSTAQGEFRRVPLEDSSVASINSDSVIAVNLTSEVRQIALRKGEAWFEVAKDRSKPFIVEAGDIRVRAVGTAFSVRRHGTGAEVLVTEGKVEVWSQGGDARRHVLVSGDRGFLPSSAAQVTISHQPAEIARKLAWREGRLVFENQTLNEAVADFNRYSVKQIVVVDPDLGSKTLIGQYQIDAPERFARDVSAFLDVAFAVTPERIIIGGNVAGGKKAVD